jgi:hypothetical protein
MGRSVRMGIGLMPAPAAACVVILVGACVLLVIAAIVTFAFLLVVVHLITPYICWLYSLANTVLAVRLTLLHGERTGMRIYTAL